MVDPASVIIRAEQRLEHLVTNSKHTPDSIRADILAVTGDRHLADYAAAKTIMSNFWAKMGRGRR